MKLEFTKLEAIQYLCQTGPSYSSEWTEAGMFHIICHIIGSNNEIFTKEFLDEQIKIASDY